MHFIGVEETRRRKAADQNLSAFYEKEKSDAVFALLLLALRRSRHDQRRKIMVPVQAGSADRNLSAF